MVGNLVFFFLQWHSHQNILINGIKYKPLLIPQFKTKQKTNFNGNFFDQP